MPYGCVQVQTVQVVRTSSVKNALFTGRGGQAVRCLQNPAPCGHRAGRCYVLHQRPQSGNSGVFCFLPEYTENSSKLKRAIVYISNFRTPYRPDRLFEVRPRFFRMRTEQSSSHCANLIVILPQETFPLGESSKSPLHFAAHRDESVIVGYYTSEEVHLRSPSPLDEP